MSTSPATWPRPSLSSSSRVIGIGIDSVEVERFRTLLARQPQVRTRLFGPEELADSAALVDPAQRLASRFAAKEAVMKALGVGLGAFRFHDVCVVRSESGAPEMSVRGKAAALADERGVRRWHVSITHTPLLATAFVVAE